MPQSITRRPESTFVANLQRYAQEAEIGLLRLHQLPHSFARIVADLSGSLGEVQEALSHKHAATTRICVQRIAVERDKFSSSMLRKLGLTERQSLPRSRRALAGRCRS